MCHGAAAQSQLIAFDDTMPILDWVINSRAAPARRPSLIFVASLVLASLAIMADLLGSGLGGESSTPIAIAVVVFVALRFLPRRADCLIERILIKDGAMRIAHYQSGKLIDQRRVRLTGLEIECSADGNSACSFLVLRTDERAHRPRRRIEIARRLNPFERAEFLRDFLSAICSTGADLALFGHDGCPLALSDWLFAQSANSPRHPSPWRRNSALTATCGPGR